MFGPNTYFSDEVKICYSHRDKEFFDLYAKTRALFQEKFNLNDYDILFIPGSGTVGIEAVFYSLKSRVKLIGNDGTFKRRWTELEANYPDKKKQGVEMFCLLETSCSRPFYKEGCIVDAISGFPYYDIPRDTKIFVTCLNKQIGSYIGLSVVCVKKDYWDNLIGADKLSYLNLARYKEYAEQNQTPSTTPTYIYEHLYKHLSQFNLDEFRERINRVSDKIVSCVGENSIIGEKRCPAITLKNDVVPEWLARDENVYGYWAGRPNYQIFTYTDKESEYDRFLAKLSEARNSK